MSIISGTFSGLDMVSGPPLYYDIVFPYTFTQSYIVNIESDSPRDWSITNKTINGFRVDSNSSSPISDIIYWKATELISGNVGILSAGNELYKLIFIEKKSDFPTAIGGVITLQNNVTYFIASEIDLTGDRLIGGSNTTIIGGSSENCILKSTGLANGVPLFYSEWTTPIRDISFKDVDTAFYIDGNINPPVALDWTGVNFVNVNNVGTINTCDNFIFIKGAFLDSQNLLITGTSGTIAFNNSLFRGDGSTASLFNIDEDANITKRFRIIYSSIIAHSSTKGISFSPSASVPDENYILDTVNFSGGGDYIDGLQFNDNESKFLNCIGITNSSAIVNMFMKDNATQTVVSVTNDRYAASGTFSVSNITQRFLLDDTIGAVEYVSSVSNLFKIQLSFSILSGVNNIIGIYLGINRTGGVLDPDADRIPESEVYITASGTRPDAAFIQCAAYLEQGDRVYMIVQNKSATTNITVQFANMIIEKSVQ
jgi:hypothetical protein